MYQCVAGKAEKHFPLPAESIKTPKSNQKIADSAKLTDDSSKICTVQNNMHANKTNNKISYKSHDIQERI